MNEAQQRLNTSCTSLLGVGPKLAKTLAKCQIYTIQDILFHLPYRYQDRTRITPICNLLDKEFAVIEGTVSKQEIKFGRRTSFICYVEDLTSFIKLRFFHYHQSLKERLQEGTKIRCFGEARFIHQSIEMVHPEFYIIDEDQITTVEETLTPIYSTTQGLSQKKIRSLAKAAFTVIQNEDIELLPKTVIEKYQLPPLKEALHYLHNPPPDAPIVEMQEGKNPCQQRLALEELLSHHLSMQRIRHAINRQQAKSLTPNHSLTDTFIQSLPYALTAAQKRVCQEISNDVVKQHPMQRLLQGDVGAGKTVVAAIASLLAVAAHCQVALMAPTELLAEQHAKQFQQWFNPLGLSVCVLLGKQGSKIRRDNLAAIKKGECAIIIGTHALFQEHVDFHRLGLVIIDEQHRFGVKQRLALQLKGKQQNERPHQLIMTATPIPRTLAMTQYANFDLSVIDELPPGRLPVKTAVIDNHKREAVINRLKKAFTEKKQAYWVCTLIEESETLQCQAATDTAQQLSQLLAPFKIGLVHGRMKAKEKWDVMLAFREQAIDLLVATTVIEVGVDVPNASLMIIENAERLGLSQLHQLRGRVGRDKQQSHCLLLYQSPLSPQARSRLQIMRDTHCGFVIAEHDLKLRGSGEILGTKQTGMKAMKVACFERDKHWLKELPAISQQLFLHHKPYVQALISRWLKEAEQFVHS